MNITINWAYLIAAAFGVAGVMEYAKGFAPAAPSWLWRASLPVACVGVALVGDGGIWQAATNAVIILAVSQLCYDLVIQTVRKLLEKTGGSA